jgi:hypothetical protein
MAYNVLNKVLAQATDDATTPLIIEAHSVTQSAPILVASVADTTVVPFPIVFKGTAFGDADGELDGALVCIATKSADGFPYGLLWSDVSNFNVPVTSIQVANGNIITVTCANDDGTGHPIFVPGTAGVLLSLTVATFLNGVFMIVMSSTLTTFTAYINDFSHANYGPTAEVGTAQAFNGVASHIFPTGGLNLYQFPNFGGLYFDDVTTLGPNGSGVCQIGGGNGASQLSGRFRGVNLSFSISATSISSNILTVTHNAGGFIPLRPGGAVVLTGTAESFLNGQSFKVLTSTPTQLTAHAVYSDYTNGSDTGTVFVDSIDCAVVMSGGNGGEGSLGFDTGDSVGAGVAVAGEGGAIRVSNPATGITSPVFVGSIAVGCPTYMVTDVSSTGTAPITSVASSVGPNATYTGTFPNDANLNGNGKYTVITGFTNPVNNGVFTIVSNNATQLVVNNAAAVSETHAATASMTATYTGTFQSTSWAGNTVNIENIQLPLWLPSNPYTLGYEIIDYNAGVQQVTTAGTSGGTAPSWQAPFTGVGTTTSDGGVVWTKRADVGAFTLFPNNGTYTVVSSNATTLVVNNPQAQLASSQVALAQPSGQHTQYASPNVFPYTATAWPAAAGTAGQVLTTDGATPVQQLSWTNSFFDASGAAASATNSHTVCGTSTFPTGTPNTATISLTGAAQFSSGGSYVVQITLTQDPTSFLPFAIWVDTQTGSSFNVTNTKNTDNSTFAWTATGY